MQRACYFTRSLGLQRRTIFSSSKQSLELAVFRSSWGLEDHVMRPEKTHVSWTDAFEYLVRSGYDGIECSLGDMARDGPNGKSHAYGQERFAEALSKVKLKLICGVYTSWQDYEGANEAVGFKEQLTQYRTQLQTIKALQLSPSHVNVHSGSDWWPSSFRHQFFSEALAMEHDFDFPCSHETHRGRMLFSPFVTAELLDQFPQLMITADFSHWVVVCERLLDSQFERDIMLQCAARSLHIHARVGQAEAPQVRDPLSVDARSALRLHERWWTAIWEAKRKRGDTLFTLTPEYGPPPYLPGLGFCPETSQFSLPAVPLSHVIDLQAARQRDRFAAWAASFSHTGPSSSSSSSSSLSGSSSSSVLPSSSSPSLSASSSFVSSSQQQLKVDSKSLSFSSSSSSFSSSSSSFLPVIDISCFREGGSLQARVTVAAQIHAACQDLGFFYVTGHGISEDHCHSVLDMTTTFFAQPLEKKQQLSMEQTSLGFKSGRGYQMLGENVTQDRPDYHEALDVLRELPLNHPSLTQQESSATGYEVLARGKNKWPEPEYKALLEKHIKLMCDLGETVMRGIAMGLGLPEFFFTENGLTNDSFWLLRAISYPPLLHSKSDMSCGEHCDYGCLTFITSDDTRGALQVRTRQGEWLAADPIKGAFVVNIGDMLAFWTGGLYVSTPHRVRNTSPASRVSVPFFFEPNFDARVMPLSQISSSSAEQLVYGEHLFNKISKNFT